MIKFFVYVDNLTIVEAGRGNEIPDNCIEITKDQYVEYINGKISNDTHHIVNGVLYQKGQSAITPFSNKFKQVEDAVKYVDGKYIATIEFDKASITEEDNPNVLYDVVNKGIYEYDHPISVWAIT